MAQAQTDASVRDPASPTDGQGQMQQSIWRRFFGRDKDNGTNSVPGSTDASTRSPVSEPLDDKAGLIRRVSRKVVPGLPRVQTFKRQQSELRDNLEPVKPTPAERRAVSVDRRLHASSSAFSQSNPRTSAPDFLDRSYSIAASIPSLPTSPVEDMMLGSIGELSALEETGDAADGEEDDYHGLKQHAADGQSNIDAHSMTTSQYDSMIHDELERIWILNLSMHFRDKSKREKFFVTYRENNSLWRRVTISLDYRNAPENSLEMDLVHTKFQRDKSAKIYEAIRESLDDIQFYDTVTNLKLQTTDGRLHVHVVEDVNEIIQYPTVRMIQHMRCRRIKEGELEFDSHLSGFVYKVGVNNQVLIKKEIPGPDTIDEFLYEINALNRLRYAENVIRFYGVVVDDKEEYVKGLLISHAEQGALIDLLYDHNHSLPWLTREKWARQIVNGLAEIHEAGFVQGDFTLSNIVINDEGDAKIIDINRRGCPVGWEPPEATPLIESNQRISMYIGVKSDLFQLGMVLWALATQEDEPEAHGRPLRISTDIPVPQWYRQMVAICLNEDPRRRLQAVQLASMFPEPREESHYGAPHDSSISIEDRYSHQEFGSDNFLAHMGWNNAQYPTTEDLFYYPTRGRSPPSPMPSNQGDQARYLRAWPDKHRAAMTGPSLSDATPSELHSRSDIGLGVTRELPPVTRAAEREAVRSSIMVNEAAEHSTRTVEGQATAEPLHRLMGEHDRSLSGMQDGDRTISISHADSGKDLSEATVTAETKSVTSSNVTRAREPRRNSEGRNVVYGGTGYQDASSKSLCEEVHGDTASDLRGPSLFTATSFSSSRGTSTSTPIQEMPDDLKGVGSAYDLPSEGRGAIIPDEDLGVELHSDVQQAAQPGNAYHYRQTTTVATTN